MGDLQNITTADLIAQWEKNNRSAKNHCHLDNDPDVDSLREMFADVRAKKAMEQIAIAAELDKRSGDAGLADIGGFFGAKNISQGFGDFEGHFTILAPVCVDLHLPITTTELRDLLTWLILKGGQEG